MGVSEKYNFHCPKCNKETNHVPAQKGIAGLAFTIWKFTVFFISFGMLYPHAFADDEIMVSCTKCGMNVKMSIR